MQLSFGWLSLPKLGKMRRNTFNWNITWPSPATHFVVSTFRYAIYHPENADDYNDVWMYKKKRKKEDMRARLHLFLSRRNRSSTSDKMRVLFPASLQTWCVHVCYSRCAFSHDTQATEATVAIVHINNKSECEIECIWCACSFGGARRRQRRVATMTQTLLMTQTNTNIRTNANTQCRRQHIYTLQPHQHN